MTRDRPIGAARQVGGAASADPRGGTPKALSLALVAQAFSSATNFGLTLVVGRTLGPGGLGTVAVGFAVFVAVLGFQRSLLSEPLVVSSAAEPLPDRIAVTRDAITILLIAGLTLTVAAVGLGVTLPGFAGHGILLFAPWLAIGAGHEFAKAVLFREGHGRTAALSEGVRFCVFAGGAVIAWPSGSDWAVVGAWGAATLAGASVALSRAWRRPAGASTAVAWWRSRAWPLGRWLGLETFIYTLGNHGTVFVLAVLLGAAALGGFQAIQSVFSPLTLIVPAFALAGLPFVARRLAVSRRDAKRAALAVGAAVTFLVAIYVGLMAVVGDRLLVALFGSEFDRFTTLILPFSIAALTGGAIGWQLLLKAERRGGALLAANGLSYATSLLAAAALAAAFGIEGAAWGYAAGVVLGSVVVTALGLRRPRERSEASDSGLPAVAAAVEPRSPVIPKP